MFFAATGSTCLLYLCLFAVLRLGWAEDISNSLETTGVIRLRRMSSGVLSTSCSVPPQPMNGRWKLHRRFCEYDVDCDIPQGVMLPSGRQLVYRCNDGYKLEGNADAYCTGEETWSANPSCVEITCRSLTSVATRMESYEPPHDEIFGGQLVNSVAVAECRIGYSLKVSTFIHTIIQIVKCSINGTWEPTVAECTEDCGLTPNAPSQNSGTLKSNLAPWHASIYVSNGTRKNFRCGATIVRPNILVTVRLCVWDSKTKALIDSEKLFVMTGNTFIDYDSPMHDPEVVKTSAVKEVMFGSHRPITVMMLILQEPFTLSSTVLPTCLPSATEQLPDFPQNGITVGYGEISSNASHGILQNLTVHFISRTQNSGLFADSTNGSGICGSGLVFQIKEKWYLLRMLTPDKYDEDGDGICDGFSDSRFHDLVPSVDAIMRVAQERPNDNVIHSPMNTTSPRLSTPPTTGSPANQISPNADDSFCLVPPQPENGEWRIHESLCQSSTDCKIPQGSKLGPGSPLVYSCAPGYRASGNTDILCRFDGKWSATPSCIEVKCEALKSVSTSAFCSRFGKEVSCEYPVPAGTRAEISCSKGYQKDTVFIPTQRDVLTCTRNGEWKPEPIRCIPVCGVTITHQTPLAIGGTPAAVGDFPWHATLYKQVHSSMGSSKVFQCGATIIHAKVLLTAAHCVYREDTRTTLDPANLFVVTGNTFRNYDSSAHDPQVVRKGEVKNVHVHLNYFGFVGNYGSDIALLELKRPFDISETLLPACLDIDGKSDRILQPGAYGKVAGFGRTTSAASSANLQTVTLPFVSYSQCRNSTDDDQIKKLINDGKFCAGYTNGTSVCNGDSGGGLVFSKNEVWYVLGIVSVDLGADFDTGTKTCDPYSYTAFTKVSLYMTWIQDVIVNLED